ncbi:AtuA-related protein [Cupriavidus sp. CuC1]|uniref:AtuA-related protein n=1 Tax=Cupriavidus sp. CuC1 TaxID=3373131 RepID=UPI0037D0DEC1
MNATTIPTTTPATIALYQLAHGRTGDKGDRSNISVIAYDARDFDHLVAHVTEDAVAALFRYRQPAAVKRYLVPSLQAMNFVIDGVLDGGVNDALNLDTHGKALSFLLLQLELPLPPRLDDAG